MSLCLRTALHPPLPLQFRLGKLVLGALAWSVSVLTTQQLPPLYNEPIVCVRTHTHTHTKRSVHNEIWGQVSGFSSLQIIWHKFANIPSIFTAISTRCMLLRWVVKPN